MEQKHTINFGAGPAKLPQSVSVDNPPVCGLECGDKLRGNHVTHANVTLAKMRAAAVIYCRCVRKRPDLVSFFIFVVALGRVKVQTDMAACN